LPPSTRHRGLRFKIGKLDAFCFFNREGKLQVVDRTTFSPLAFIGTDKTPSETTKALLDALKQTAN
jgi:hypothetical protein